MNRTVNITYHAADRIHERCGISKKSAKRCAELAATRGQHYTETKGPVRKWLEDQIREDGRQIYVHGDKAYIFADSLVLVTVLQLPPEIVRCNIRNLKKAHASMRRGLATAPETQNIFF